MEEYRGKQSYESRMTDNEGQAISIALFLHIFKTELLFLYNKEQLTVRKKKWKEEKADGSRNSHAISPKLSSFSPSSLSCQWQN